MIPMAIRVMQAILSAGLHEKSEDEKKNARAAAWLGSHLAAHL